MDMPPRLPPKKDVALALLQGGPSVYVHLDPRRDGVLVPKNFKKQAQLVLQLGMSMAIPIPDLEVDDDGITCTLSFSRTPFWCRLPWTAVFALVGEDGRGMVWPDDIPPEIAQQQQRPSLKVVSSPSKKKAKPTGERKAEGPLLAAVPPVDEEDDGLSVAATPEAADEGEGAEAAADAAEEEGKKRDLPPYLRVIK